MTWRVYRWDDPDSPPQLSANGNSLIWLLDAVLIGSGGFAYGSKPSAGWTGAHIIGDSVARYTNAGSGKTLVVTHNSATAYAGVVGCESSDGTTGPFFPTTAQQASGLFWTVSNTSDGTARPWIILADDKRFYLWIGYNLTTAQALSASTTIQQLHFAGDMLPYKGSDAHHFMLWGGTTNASNNSPGGACQASIGGSLATGHYVARSHTQAGGSVQVGKLADFGLVNNTASGQITSTAYPDTISGGMLLSPVRLFESNVWGPRGLMPGMWFVNHSLPGANGDTFAGSAGGPFAGKSFMLLDVCTQGSRNRFALETSDTIGY